MRFSANILLICVFCAPLLAQDDAAKPAAAASKYETTKDKVSYAIGRNIGNSLKSQGLDVDLKILVAAISEALAGKEATMTREEMQAAFAAMQQEQNAKQLAEEAKFLAANAKKEGVKVTESGLQYIVLRKGTGSTPEKSDSVSTHYRGKLLNGDVFDESYSGEVPGDEDEPRSFPVSRVIPGWTEALQLMKEGEKLRIYVPSKLAYGPQGAPPRIPGNATLIFDMELLSIDK